MKTRPIIFMFGIFTFLLTSCHKPEPPDPREPFYGTWEATEIEYFTENKNSLGTDDVDGITLLLNKEAGFKVLSGNVVKLEGDWYYDEENHQIIFSYAVDREISIGFIYYSWESTTSKYVEVWKITDTEMKLFTEADENDYFSYFALTFQRLR